MSDANRDIPHFRLSATLLMEPMNALLSRMKADGASAKVSLTALFVKAAAHALVRVREMNVQWRDGALFEYEHADISVIAAVDGGVSTPVIFGADRMQVEAIAEALSSLVERARSGDLKLREISGGTLTISNLGMFGVESFDAIINAPQCSVLALGAVRRMVIAGSDGSVDVRPVVSATLSADHRAVDGVAAARFLAAFKNAVEEPWAKLIAETNHG
jgi:pyruvate dehydrogenase E2 component (dihydrolipoamide acetyltransferase)